MAKRKPTIHEVAHLAQVGIGTVSRVLNNHPSVRPETRNRVLSAMAHLGYSPNPHARRVAGGRSYTVSVILPVISTEFYSRLLEGIEQVLADERYEIALFPIFSPQRLRRYLENRSLAYQTDGLLVASQGLAHLLPHQKFPTERPVVLVDAHSPHYDSAYLDNRLGGRMAAQHLAQFPGSFFAIEMQEELDRVMGNTVGKERVVGFREGLQALGYDLPPTHIFPTRFSAEGGRLALQHFMRLAPPPYNIFAGADLLALGVLEEAERQGLRVGWEVRLLGFDGHPWTEARGLSTLAQPIEDMGAAAARLLMERIRGYCEGPRTLRFEPTLVVRASTQPPDNP
ncbi:LacI family DNA-binding transcriptional regulator [Meiothermus sp. QL-1]|uniref:LacI family DNA-binding transcriptional regulator n=1 Tax=Meiothermus sp. QL-1 TaxID=2058095 RepID=UPI000E0A48EB|nr:LacI family DNA-binding transcriptional regulator [Meiothermus sp. QL-1]RDI95760.1 LacI family DNA-binding transcriptional regulator [Meiothermus sp. QL-1]